MSTINPPAPPSPFRPDILRGHVSLITGGGSGIGLEISRQLGLHGSAIVIMGRRENVLTSAVEALKGEGIDAIGVKGDVRSPEAASKVLDETVSKFGNLDLLVNCAAGNFLSPAEDLTTRGFRTVIEIDTIGTFNMSRAAYPLLCKSKNPSIINISATLHLPATQYQVHASAAKAAIDSITRTLALEWGPDKIRVNGVAPGPIAETAGMSKLGGDMAEGGAGVFVAEAIPLGRLGTKADIALGCVYLTSSAGSYVTGDTLTIDGGQVLYRPPLAPKDAVKEFAKNIEKKSRNTGLAKPAGQINSKL